jgi:hypothetical protein
VESEGVGEPTDRAIARDFNHAKRTEHDVLYHPQRMRLDTNCSTRILRAKTRETQVTRQLPGGPLRDETLPRYRVPRLCTSVLNHRSSAAVVVTGNLR